MVAISFIWILGAAFVLLSFARNLLTVRFTKVVCVLRTSVNGLLWLAEKLLASASALDLEEVIFRPPGIIGFKCGILMWRLFLLTL